MIILVHQLYLLAQSAFRWILWKYGNTNKFDENDESSNFPFLCDKKTICSIQKGKTMFIMRDASGCRTSTVVKSISKVYENVCLCSSHQHFMEKDVDPKQLSVAHDECVEKAKKACLKGVPVVVIDNTNVKPSEIENYLHIAATNNYAVFIVRPKTPLSRDEDKLMTVGAKTGKLTAFEDFIVIEWTD